MMYAFLFFARLLLGWPKLLWVVTESKHLSKPPREWYPLIKDANNDTAYIEVLIVFQVRIRAVRLNP